MLILTRRISETLIVGEDVMITVLGGIKCVWALMRQRTFLSTEKKFTDGFLMGKKRKIEKNILNVDTQ